MSSRRTRKTRQYPMHTLQHSLVIAETIHNHNAGMPFDRVLLAKALDTTPASSEFKMRLKSAAGYGITKGGSGDKFVSLTPLGESIFDAPDAIDYHRGLLTAALTPELFHRFFQLLDGKKLPDDINVSQIIHSELQLDQDLSQEFLDIIKKNGVLAGLLGDIGGSLYVSIDGSHSSQTNGSMNSTPKESYITDNVTEHPTDQTTTQSTSTPSRIFIGHAGNSEIAHYLTAVLDSFSIPYQLVESDYDATRPISEEISQSLKLCDAAILIFAAPIDRDWLGRRDAKCREKLFFQVGAASALYGDRVLLIAETSYNDHTHNSQFTINPDLQFERDHLNELGIPFLSELCKRRFIQVSIKPV